METLEELKEKLKKAQAIPEKGVGIKTTIHNLEILIKHIEAKQKR